MAKYGLGKRIKITLNPKSTENKKPGKTIKKNLLAKSQSQIFEEAKDEWNIESVIDSTCDGFSGSCQLCHTSRLKYNFVLTNPNTNQTLHVGTTCILRFHVGKGVVSVESGITLLQNLVDEQYLINYLQTHIKNMMPIKVDRKELKDFCENLKRLMELRGIKSPSTEQLAEVCFGSAAKIQDDYVLTRLRKIWDNPGLIETKPSARRIRTDKQPKEGTTWQKKRTRIATTLASSELYDVERYIVESDRHNK